MKPEPGERFALRDAVELRAQEAEAADQRLDRAVLGAERDERRFGGRHLREHPVGLFGLLGDLVRLVGFLVLFVLLGPCHELHAHDVAALEHVADALGRRAAAVLVDARARPVERREIERDLLAVGRVDDRRRSVDVGDDGRDQARERVVVEQRALPVGLAAVGSKIDVRLGPAIAVARSYVTRSLRSALLRRFLAGRVERRLDDVAIGQRVVAEPVHRFQAHHLGEIRRIDFDRRLVRKGRSRPA